MALTFKVITDDLTGKVIRSIASKATRAEHAAAVQAAKDTEPFVPFDTGSLADRTQVEGNTITYPGPYARYLYYGKVMVDERGNGPRHFVDQFGNEVIAFPTGSHLHPTDRDLVFSKAGNPQAQAHWFEAAAAQYMDKWVKVAAEEMKNGDK